MAHRTLQLPVFRHYIVHQWFSNFIPEIKTLPFIFVGVPKSRRGEIWQFLALQYRLRHRLPNKQQPPDVSYKELLKQLTAQQHAILVDLGMFVILIIVQKQTIRPFPEYFGGFCLGFCGSLCFVLVLVLLKRTC